MRHTLARFAFMGGAVIAAAAQAQATQPDLSVTVPAVQTQGDLLGAPFENDSAGISLRLPVEMHRIAATGAGDDLGEFGDEKRNWQMKITRLLYPKPTTLATITDNFGKTVPGLLDLTVAKLQRDLPGCQVLRHDLVNVRDGSPFQDKRAAQRGAADETKNNAAMIVVRYTATGAHFLSQEAIIESNNRLFFAISLTSPAGNASGPDAPVDPGERSAVEAFRQMLDSVRLLDTRKIREEQDDRQFHTFNLVINWTPSKLQSVLIGEQWLRIQRRGQDVGYSYVTEQTAAGIPRPLRVEEVRQGKSDRDIVQPGEGILIGVRGRSMELPAVIALNVPVKPVQVDTANWMWVSPDRKLEDWSSITVFADGKPDKNGKPTQRQTEEFGSSHWHVTRVPDARAGADKSDPNQPAMRIREEYVLDVTPVSSSGAAEPITRELPRWYLPQALSYLLPRLLPLNRPNTYMFATWVPESREVMVRYVDVLKPQKVALAGKSYDAVPITDRIGWHGSITTHYMSLDGRYLGSENRDSGLLILPVDAKTLLSIWKNANLTQPGGTERPGASGEASSNELSAGGTGR